MRGKLEQQPAGIRLPCSVRIWNPATPPAHAWTGRGIPLLLLDSGVGGAQCSDQVSGHKAATNYAA
ncbi:uncharacterized protein LOC115760888 isoform X2 [Drosophila novamexicana]|uniref:uncharacterized protein LOC115760888 isoform X2 n=1 Tax=Drosophila novamexicana TaxID=47314 RepID=UPI0011E5C136|nr:uncharacterized protein LOC115760888 isoform X2 [Drosophila novamexicana]